MSYAKKWKNIDKEETHPPKIQPQKISFRKKNKL
jgi:hypothetical protein